VRLAAGALINEAINSPKACQRMAGAAQREWLKPSGAFKHLNGHVAAIASYESVKIGAYETVKSGMSRNHNRHRRVAVLCAILDEDSHRSGRCNGRRRAVFVSITQIRVTHDPGEDRNEANPATIMAETLQGLPAPLVPCLRRFVIKFGTLSEQ